MKGDVLVMVGSYKEFYPEIDKTAMVAQNATVIGRCKIGKDANIWYGAVLRGDVEEIVIGDNTNVQDGAVLHSNSGKPTGTTTMKTIVGNGVTIGHNAIVHACTVKDNCLIGMGATILDGAIIEENVIIGANSLVAGGKVIPKNSLVMGSPAKVIRELTEKEIEGIKISAQHYVELSKSIII